MKRKILIDLVILVFSLISFNTMAQSNEKTNDSDTLCILWTSGDPEVAFKMVFMYAGAAKRNKWFNEIDLIIWGPSSKLVSENKDIQEAIAKMMKEGIKIEACEACADLYGVTDKLRSMGIDVKFMGVPLTNILKSGKKLLTI